MKTALRRPGGALLVGALLAGGFTLMPAAHAAPGTVSGMVTGTTGPLDSVSVQAYVLEDGYWNWVEDGYTSTDIDGTYALSLPPGDYRIGFDDYTGAHIEEFHLDAATVEAGQTFTVGDGGSQVINADLPEASHITGSLTGPDQLPLANINVAALKEFPNGPDDSYWDAVGFGETDVDGNYDIGGLPAGTYRVEFGDRLNANDYASEFYNDQATAVTAQDIEVANPGSVENIDAELAFESTISGTVTGAADEPLAGTGVYVYERAGGAWAYLDEVTTDVNGDYTLSHLPRGTYRVEFSHRTPDNDYLFEWWNNQRWQENADDIAVGVNEDVIRIDAKLVAGEHDPVPFTMNAAPTISGTPQVGSTLTVTGGSWTPTPTTTEYHWFRGEEYTGVSATTYVPTAADLGQTLSVLVQVYGPADLYDYANTGAYGPIVAVPVVSPPPVVTVPATVTPAVSAPVITFSKAIRVKGPRKVGTTLKLKGYKVAVTQSTAPATYKLQWFKGKKKIKKATKPKLKLTKDLKGKKVSVKVVAKVGKTKKAKKIKVGRVR